MKSVTEILGHLGTNDTSIIRDTQRSQSRCATRLRYTPIANYLQSLLQLFPSSSLPDIPRSSLGSNLCSWDKSGTKPLMRVLKAGALKLPARVGTVTDRGLRALTENIGRSTCNSSQDCVGGGL